MKKLWWLAAAVLAVIVVMCCGLPLAALVTSDDPSGDCASGNGTAVTAGGKVAAVGRWDSAAVANAAIIVATGHDLGVPARGWVIAVATAMTESSLHNSAVATDHDSVGLFQQRPSQGWGTIAQLTDPVYASRKFYQALQRVSGWQTLPLTVAAQKVQRSAFPERYAKYEQDAQQVVSVVVAGDPAAISAVLGPCANPCPATTASAPTPATGAAGACTNVNTVFTRAKSWLIAWSGGPVPYRSDSAPASLFDGYRRDCSGYVSMGLGLPGPGLNTIELAARFTPIAKTQLHPGDLMIHPASGGAGHVVLFERWADASQTSYWGYEQSGDGGTHYREVPYPYFGTYQMAPYTTTSGIDGHV